MKPMNDKVFLDSNIIIYLYSIDEPTKKHQAQQLIETHQSLISTQVINELINVLYKKKRLDVTSICAAFVEIETMLPIVEIKSSTIAQALLIMQTHKYSYFDSLIIATALENNCGILYTEDMHDTHKIRGLTIKNPFK